MIYTVTFNPAIDYLLWTENFTPGITNRATREELQFGGKGINVSTVLSRLGEATTALGFVAGFTGDALEVALRQDGVNTDLIRLSQGHTRINVKLKGECETEINAVGPVIDGAALKTLFRKLDGLQAGDTLVLAGSVPAGLPADIYERILQALQGRQLRCVVDTAGELLRRVLPYRPFLIKPNRQELEELMGASLPDDGAVAEAARALQRQGAVNVLVSLGKEGALLLDEQGRVHRQPALGGRPVNTVGAGDSMVAGFLAGVSQGYAYALRLGAAAGGATACSLGLAQKEDVLALMEIKEKK